MNLGWLLLAISCAAVAYIAGYSLGRKKGYWVGFYDAREKFGETVKHINKEHYAEMLRLTQDLTRLSGAVDGLYKHAIGCHTCEHCDAPYNHDEICNECNGGSNWVMRGMH